MCMSSSLCAHTLLGVFPLQNTQLNAEVKIFVSVPRFLFLFHLCLSSLSSTSLSIIDNLDL